jgi:hypothetical protein
MVTIHTSQCGVVPAAGGELHLTAPLPANHRGSAYERMLAGLPKGAEVVTYDELLILVAQHLHRRKIIRARVIHWCGCSPPRTNFQLDLDYDGDFVDDMPHGFFSQRLPYLR